MSVPECACSKVIVCTLESHHALKFTFRHVLIASLTAVIFEVSLSYKFNPEKELFSFAVLLLEVLSNGSESVRVSESHGSSKFRFPGAGKL